MPASPATERLPGLLLLLLGLGLQAPQVPGMPLTTLLTMPSTARYCDNIKEIQQILTLSPPHPQDLDNPEEQGILNDIDLLRPNLRAFLTANFPKGAELSVKRNLQKLEEVLPAAKPMEMSIYLQDWDDIQKKFNVYLRVLQQFLQAKGKC